MKKAFLKLICISVMCLLFVQSFPVVHASSDEAVMGSMYLVSQYTEQVSEDLFIDFFVYEDCVTSRGSVYQKTGKKTAVGRNANGIATWTFSVTGVFTVTQGAGAVCTSAVSSYEIYDSNWFFNGATCRTSGNQAIGNAEFIKKILSINMATETCNVVLTCDANGNLS